MRQQLRQVKACMCMKCANTRVIVWVLIRDVLGRIGGSAVEEQAANDVLRNLAFEDLEEQADEVHTPDTPQHTVQLTPISRSEPRSRTAQHTPAPPATPTLYSSLLATR